MEKTLAFVREQGFDRLYDMYGISVKRVTIPETGRKLVLLDYSQIESPRGEQIVKECRGVIIDETDLTVVCRPFDRFFNWGEMDTIEKYQYKMFNFAKKHDGSLIKVYFVDGKWRVSTRGMPFADGVVGDSDLTFADLFRRTMGLKTDEEMQQRFMQSHMEESYTYIFELCARLNRVVTPYPSDFISLLAIRDNATGKYVHRDRHINDKWMNPVPVEYRKSIPEMIEKADNLKGLEEGFVAYDEFGVPVFKLKSPVYLVAHKLRGNNGITRNSIAEMVATNEQGEYLAYFPDDAEIIMPVVEAWQDRLIEIVNVWEKHKGVVDQKEFAQAIQADLKDDLDLLFTARKKGVTIQEALQDDPLVRRAKRIYRLIEKEGK